jgi:hypothetical protein
VRPESLSVEGPSVAEVLELAEGSRLTTLSVRRTPLGPSDLEPVGRLRALRVLGLSAKRFEGWHISPMKELPNLTAVRLACQSITPDACAELAELPSSVRVILFAVRPSRTMVAQVQELRKARNVEVEGPWRVWFKESQP